MKRKRTNRGAKSLVGVLVLAGILTSATYAFTASVTVPVSQAGDGNTAVLDNSVTAGSVHYTLSASFANVTGVTFTLANVPTNAAMVIRAKLVSSSATWTNNCSLAGAVATCAYAAGSEPLLTAVNDLRIIAVD